MPVNSYTANSDFSDLYFNLRQKEGRVYTDEEVASLPLIDKAHPHHREWQMRKQSSAKLIAYLGKKKSPLKILEPGCGNGWFAHQLSRIYGSEIVGSDINFTELQQAKRVFAHVPNLHFIHGTIHSEMLKHMKFDTIVLASCIQYFPSVPAVINDLFRLLVYKGEIHILDSPFYRDNEIATAKERTARHYRHIGFPAMTGHYFHHKETDLEQFDPKVFYRPSFINSRFLNNKSVFPWFCIRKGTAIE